MACMVVIIKDMVVQNSFCEFKLAWEVIRQVLLYVNDKIQHGVKIMAYQLNDKSDGDLLELLLENGIDGLPEVFTCLINQAMEL